MMKVKWILLFMTCGFLSGCENIAVLTTPAKKPIASDSQLAKDAQNKFWITLHQGDYYQIDNAKRLLMAAYLKNPHDPQIAAHLGFLHIWQLTERARLKDIPPTIVDNSILSQYYFADAVELAPDEARYLGFLGDSQLATGSIFHDDREEVHGYFTLKKAIRMWPEFNYFTGGYVMSSMPAESKQFKEGLAWQWNTLDLCALQPVSHANPDFSPFMKYETQVGPKRACWNSWIAPYNFEGFFLNMGDMLVKAGQWQTAIKIYRNATLASNYSSWPYRTLLEDRIANAQSNVKFFQNVKLATNPNQRILFNSGYGCAACHQNSKSK